MQATEVDGVPIVLAAKSREVTGDNAIFIWKKVSEKRSEPKIGEAHQTMAFMKLALHCVMFVASVAFVHQNFSVVYEMLGIGQMRTYFW